MKVLEALPREGAASPRAVLLPVHGLPSLERPCLRVPGEESGTHRSLSSPRIPGALRDPERAAWGGGRLVPTFTALQAGGPRGPEQPQGQQLDRRQNQNRVRALRAL